MSGILRGNCCETCRNIPQKTPMNGFTKKNSLTRKMLFWNVGSNVLQIKKKFDEVAVGSRLVFLKLKHLYTFRNS